jgi:hypothetical protein
MVLVAYIPFIVMVVGLLLWCFARYRPGTEAGLIGDVGRWMFICGLLVFLFSVSRNVIRIG